MTLTGSSNITCIKDITGVSTVSLLFFDPILFILAGNDNMHESSDEFEFMSPSTESGTYCFGADPVGVCVGVCVRVASFLRVIF